MHDETQALPGFDSLRAALMYGFEDIQRESDPFHRLAWLIERQEFYFQQRGLKPRVPQVLGLSDAEMLLQNCEEVLRNYHELNCGPDFPRQLIQEGLSPATRKEFLGVLGEVEKGETDFGIDFDDSQVLDEIEYWLGFHQAVLTVRRPVSGLNTILDELRQACDELNDPQLGWRGILGQVTGAFVSAETLLRRLLSFYGRAFYGPNYVDAILQQYRREAEEKARRTGDITSLPEPYFRHNINCTWYRALACG